MQRCQWHKRENVVSYLPTSKQATFRQKLQRAYDQPTYAKAKSALSRIRSELTLLKASAVGSLDEGFEETLTVHRLGLFEELGRSFFGDKLHRELEFSAGSADGQGGLLEERGSEAPLAGHGALGHRAAATQSVRLQTTGPPTHRAANALERLPRRGGVNPWSRSQFQLRMALTRKGQCAADRQRRSKRRAAG